MIFLLLVFEAARSRNKFYCGETMLRDSLEVSLSSQLLRAKTPQFERLFLFFLDHFSVAFDAYKKGHSYVKHMKILRKHTNASFSEMLKSTISDPAMLVYLTNDSSTPLNPNENLAREFLELFSLGKETTLKRTLKTLR